MELLNSIEFLFKTKDNVMYYMEKDRCLAKITYNFIKDEVSVENYTDDFILKPFGLKLEITMKDFNYFLESRCFPKARFNCEQLLNDLGLETYDPYSIIQKTHGRQYEDYCWIKFEGEEVDYERNIKLRE